MPFVTSRIRRAPARRRKNPRFGKHRPTLFFGRKGWKAGKRSRLVKRGTRINPRRKSRKARVRHVIRYNPFAMRTMKRRSRRRVRRNPNIMKALTSKPVLMRGVAIGGGIVGGYMTLPLIARFLPEDMRTKFDPYLGTINVLIGALMFGFLRNKHLKEAGMVIAGTGIYDLVASNVPQLGLPQISRSNTLIDGAFGPGGAGISYYTPRMPALAAPSMNASYFPSGSAVALSGDNPYSDIPGYDC